MMNKVKPLHIMLPKVSTYVKCYDGQTKWIYFLIEPSIMLFGIKSMLIFKKNLIASLSMIKNLIVMKLQIFTINKFLR